MFARKSLYAVILLVVAAGCSLKKYAINKIGDTLASGNSVYESDEDIELVGEALPFGLKLMESLLAESPNHRGLLVSACQGFVLYSYAYVDYEAQLAEDEDLDRARALRTRARKLYLRAFRYGMRGLEVSYPELESNLVADPAAAVGVIHNRKKKAARHPAALLDGRFAGVGDLDVYQRRRVAGPVARGRSHAGPRLGSR